MKNKLIILIPFILSGCSVFYPNAYPGAVNGNISQEYNSSLNNYSHREYVYPQNTVIKNNKVFYSDQNQNNDLQYLYNNKNNYQENKVQSVYCQNQGMSQLIGGVAGGALGSLFGNGYGKIGTVAAGTIVGATIAGVPCY